MGWHYSRTDVRRGKGWRSVYTRPTSLLIRLYDLRNPRTKPIPTRYKEWMIRSVDHNDVSAEHGTFTDQGEIEYDVSENEDSDDLL